MRLLQLAIIHLFFSSTLQSLCCDQDNTHSSLGQVHATVPWLARVGSAQAVAAFPKPTTVLSCNSSYGVSASCFKTAAFSSICDRQVIEKMKTAGGASNNGFQSKKVRKTDAAEPACHNQSCKEGLKSRAAGLSNPQPKSVQRAKVTLSAHQHMYVAILWCLTNVCLV